MKPRPSIAPVALALSLLLAGRAGADDSEATEATTAESAKPTIVISGDDPELVESVAAELRAAGFDVVVVAGEADASKEATIVNIEHIGDSVVVHATRPDGPLEAELLESKGSDGMTDRQATALRTAEAIRSVATLSPRKRKAPPELSDAPDAAEASPPERPAAPLPSPEPPPIAAPQMISSEDAMVPDGELLEVPVFRMALFSGGGFITPTPSIAFGLSMRGQLSPKVNLAGILMGTTTLSDELLDGGDAELHGARAALLANWEILGADNIWTPSIGGGILGEVRYWEGLGRHSFDTSSPGEELTLGESSYMSPISQGAMAGVGLAATAGLSVGHPWRFRFDVLADVRVISIELDGTGHEEMAPELAPSVIGTVGLEYDFISRKVLRRTARR